MTVICQACNHENEAGKSLCDKCGEQLLEEQANKYDVPLQMLTDIVSKISKNRTGYTQERIGEAVNHIMEITHDLLDNSQKEFELNLSDLENLSREEAERLGFDIDEDKSMQIFKEFLAKFQSAQDNISEGLYVAKDALKSMTSFSEFEVSKGRIELEKSLGLMQHGLNSLEIITEQAKNKMFLEEEIEPLPGELIKAMNSLEQVMNGITDYINTRDKNILMNNIPALENILDCFYEILDSPEPDEEEDE